MGRVAKVLGSAFGFLVLSAVVGLVLARMAELGVITPAQAASAEQVDFARNRVVNLQSGCVASPYRSSATTQCGPCCDCSAWAARWRRGRRL